MKLPQFEHEYLYWMRSDSLLMDSWSITVGLNWGLHRIWCGLRWSNDYIDDLSLNFQTGAYNENVFLIRRNGEKDRHWMLPLWLAVPGIALLNNTATTSRRRTLQHLVQRETRLSAIQDGKGPQLNLENPHVS